MPLRVVLEGLGHKKVFVRLADEKSLGFHGMVSIQMRKPLLMSV